MGAILAAGLPAGAAASALGGTGGSAAGTQAARAELAAAIHPVFLIGVPMMVITFVLVALIPETPLRRAVRDDVQTGEAIERDALARRRAYFGSTRSSASCCADCSSSISKMPVIVALKVIVSVLPGSRSFLMS